MEKYFSLEDRLNLPKQVVFKEVGDKFLAIAPLKPNWIVLTHDEKRLVELLVSNISLREALTLSGSQIPTDNALDVMRSVLIKIECAGFYEATPSIDLDKDRPPTRLQLYLTNRCNLNCITCYREAGTELEHELSSEEWSKVIADFNGIAGPTLVAFSGGEPLMRKDFFDIARESKIRKNENFLFTNGILILRDNIDKIVAYIDKIQVSVDGTNPSVHNKIRGEKSFERTMQGLKLLGGTDIEVTISYCATPSTVPDARDNLVDFISSLGLKNVRVGLSLARQIGRWKTNCGGCRDYSLGNAYDELKGTLHALYDKGWDTPSISRNIIKRNCNFGQRFVVDPIGNVFPCAETVWSLGNVRTTPLPEIYSRLANAQVLSDIEHTPSCSPCDLRYICKGGCKTLRAQVLGSPFQQTCDDTRKNLIYKKMVDGVLD